jgi:CO/xanthine dehydrogenase FAD-binding subunit
MPLHFVKERTVMIPMEYLAPKTFEELCRDLEGKAGQVKFVAGCTNVLPSLRASAVSRKFLVNLQGVEGMTGIIEEEQAVSVGALTTMSELASSEIIKKWAPALASAARQMGNPLVRNRATLGGNLADASPAADSAPPLLSLGAVIQTLQANGGKREIPVDRLFEGPHRTVLGSEEVLTWVTFPKPKDPARNAYIKLGLRNASAISVVSVSLLLEMEGKVCRKARVALGSVAPIPMRAYTVERTLEGEEIDQRITERCADMIKGDIAPISDIRGSAEYRRWTASVVFRRALQTAMEGGRE